MRRTSEIRGIFFAADKTTDPVLPAETKVSAFPSPTSLAATTIDASGLASILVLGES